MPTLTAEGRTRSMVVILMLIAVNTTSSPVLMGALEISNGNEYDVLND